MRRYADRSTPPDLAHLPDQPPAGEGDVIGEIVDHLLSGRTREQVRRAFAGTAIYVAVRPRLTESQRRSIAEQLQRESVAVVARRWGITERHCRRFRRGPKPRSGGI